MLNSAARRGFSDLNFYLNFHTFLSFLFGTRPPLASYSSAFAQTWSPTSLEYGGDCDNLLTTPCDCTGHSYVTVTIACRDIDGATNKRQLSKFSGVGIVSVLTDAAAERKLFQAVLNPRISVCFEDGKGVSTIKADWRSKAAVPLQRI